jgi:outer membrane biogenesis lipoprotein LolB
MKLLIPSLAVLMLAGCTNTINTHRKDFSPSGAKGTWTDYNNAVKHGQKWEPPKEKK